MKNNKTQKIKKSAMGVKTSRTIGNIVVYIVLGLITIIWLFPFFGILLDRKSVV